MSKRHRAHGAAPRKASDTAKSGTKAPSSSANFGAGASGWLSRDSALERRPQLGQGRKLADLIAEKEQKHKKQGGSAGITSRNPSKTAKSKANQSLQQQYEFPEDEEIAYLQKKLGIKSTDDLSDDSKLIKELRMDGMTDFFDIIIPEMRAKVAKGSKPVAKFKDKLTRAVQNGTLSDSDTSEQEFPMMGSSDSEDNEAGEDQDNADDYDEEEEEVDGPEQGEEESGAEDEPNENDDSDREDDEDDDEEGSPISTKTVPKRSIQEALQQRRQDAQQKASKVSVAQGLKALAKKATSSAKLIQPQDSSSEASSSESESEPDSASESEREEEEDYDDMGELSDLLNEGEEEDEDGFDFDEEDFDEDIEEDHENAELEEAKEVPTRKPDIFGRDIAAQNAEKGRDSTLLTTQSSLAELLKSQAAGVNKYIPPHIRRKLAAEGIHVDAMGRPIAPGAGTSTSSAAEPKKAPAAPAVSEKQLRVRQSVTSTLNKITSDNAEAMYREMVKLTEHNSRGEVMDALCFCTLELILSQPRLMPAILLAITSIVACFHRKEGTHIGSLFMERTVREIKVLIENPGQLKDTNPKAGAHLIIFLAGLLLFKVVHAQLVVNVLTHIAEDCSAWDEALALLYHGFRYAGMAIRKDEPAMLKDLILLIQRRVKAEANKPKTISAAHEATMMEAISNVRNNKPTTEDSEREQLVKVMLKWMEKEGATNERQMAVTWDDIMQADTVGRWWLVGAAFRPDSIGSKRGAPGGQDGGNSKRVQRGGDADDELGTEPVSSDILTRAAIAQGMNTSVRRAVFSILMGSSDFLDTYEKLSKLNLNSQQSRQAVRVIFHCCAREQASNPYYGAVLSKLCGREKEYKFTTQLVLWDVLKEWKSTNENDDSSKSSLPRQVNNIGRMISLCIEHGTLPLTILKQLDFDALSATDLLFLQSLFSQLFSRVSSKSELQTISHCLVAKREIDLLRNGIKFFIQHYMMRILKKKNDLQTMAVAKHFIALLE